MEEKYIQKAIIQAKKALKKGEVPVGSIVVYKNKIIGKGYNKKEKRKNPLLHAELISIRAACKKIKDWRLNECVIYTTLFPCPMCASAIQQSRIKKIFYIFDSKDEISSNISKTILKKSNHVVETEKIKFESDILDVFFKKIRKKEKK